MNSVFELQVEVRQFEKAIVKDFACLTSEGKLFHKTAPL